MKKLMIFVIGFILFTLTGCQEKTIHTTTCVYENNNYYSEEVFVYNDNSLLEHYRDGEKLELNDKKDIDWMLGVIDVANQWESDPCTTESSIKD